MAYGSIIVKRVEIKEFLDTIKEYSREEIECTNHTFFRLSDQQKKIYTPEKLREIILFETPILVGIQENRNYAAFYKKIENKILRIILDIQIGKINIVTFYFINSNSLPKI